VTVAADLAGVARVQGPAVDLGPWELPGEIFSYGFESGDACAWSAALGDTGPSC
jgi:hypothetical protein